MPIANVVYRHREAGAPLTDAGAYERAGGWAGLKRALAEMQRDEVLYAFHRSGLRGRGGAGFPMGRKASFIPKVSTLPGYLIVYAYESEWGSLQACEIMEMSPF